MILVDINMPDNCYQCPIRKRHYCSIKKRVLDSRNSVNDILKRPDWCPLKEVNFYGSMYNSK